MVRAGRRLQLPSGSLLITKAMGGCKVEVKDPRRQRPGQSGTFVGTRIQPDLLAEIDAWRRAQPDLPSRPEALRRLAVKGLASS
jgi:hypothetical protein